MPNDIISEEEITGIVLNKNELILEKDNSEKLSATIIPSTAPPVTINWESSDDSVATVDSEGNVTAVGGGECIITASVEEITADCSVQVKIYPTSISLNYSEISHIFGETPVEDLVVTFEPEDCTETDLQWTTSNEDIVKYDTDENIIVYGGSGGQCVLTATDVEDHVVECTFDVYIRAEKPDPPVAINIREDVIVLEARPNTVYSINMGETWQNSNIFDGLERNKKYYFIQKEIDHGYIKESQSSDAAEIKTKDIVHVESVELNAHELTINLDDGPGVFNFETTVLPEDADVKNVYYSLDNTSIGFVDSEGRFRAVNYGECTVTVTSIDGRKTDTCNIRVYKKWETPGAPIVTEITRTSITVITSNLTAFSLDGGSVWERGPVITGLSPKTSYNIICKTLAEDLRNESDVSPKTLITTPERDPDPEKPDPIGITLSAHKLEFDLSNNTYTTLLYTILPLDNHNNDVIWYTDDSSVISIGSGGEINAIGTGKATVYIRTIAGGKTDRCECTVYKTQNRPDPPTAIVITNHTIELDLVEGCEYSIDGEQWYSSPIFMGLNKNSYYTLYQRYKRISEYEPASEASYGLTVKTLTDETPGGESESGYTWGQEVECNNIPVYASPYVEKASFNISGTYYIFNLIECNHRIRLVKSYDYAGVYGRVVGWVNIADLKLIEKVIYVGDKVVVNGNINIYADDT